MKRVLTVQDISCVGKCSLTVALPIISACSVETAVLPTAVLSTHTAFEGFTFCDLTKEIEPVKNHLKEQNIAFDAIYTGYLGSFEQVDLVCDLCDTFKTENNLIIVDPVMGDNGKLYAGFDENFARKMASLCAKADVIMPNMTEVAYLLGEEYKTDYTEEEIKQYLEKLCALGCKTAIITGVTFDKEHLGVYGLDKGSFFKYTASKINAAYHGTGDCFASAFTGAVMRGKSVAKASEIAADFTACAINKTLEDKDGRWYGVNFEEVLPQLIERVKG